MIAEDEARLACYDEKYGDPTPTGISRAEAPAAAADFGLSEKARADRDPERARVENPDSITATVEAITKRPRGESVVRLDNGQVWVQTERNSMARLSPGDTVTIRKAALGSYLLVTRNNVATRVKRTE